MFSDCKALHSLNRRSRRVLGLSNSKAQPFIYIGLEAKERIRLISVTLGVFEKTWSLICRGKSLR